MLNHVDSFDDAIRILTLNLLTLQAASSGGYDFTKLSSDDLSASWRSIEGCSELLRVALRGFRPRHTLLVDYLSSPDLLGEDFRADLRERAQASRLPLWYAVLYPISGLYN